MLVPESNTLQNKSSTNPSEVSFEQSGIDPLSILYSKWQGKEVCHDASANQIDCTDIVQILNLPGAINVKISVFSVYELKSLSLFLSRSLST